VARPLRSPPRARGRGASSRACRLCRRGSGRARRCPALQAATGAVARPAPAPPPRPGTARLRHGAGAAPLRGPTRRRPPNRAVAPPSSLAASTNRRTFERGDDLVGGKRSAQRKPALELAGKLVERLERPQILPRLLPDGRRFEPVRRTHREACEVKHGVERRL